jgi:hypothetical protein
MKTAWTINNNKDGYWELRCEGQVKLVSGSIDALILAGGSTFSGEILLRLDKTAGAWQALQARISREKRDAEYAQQGIYHRGASPINEATGEHALAPAGRR